MSRPDSREDGDRIEDSILSARGGSFSALGQLLEHYRAYLLRVANEETPSDLVGRIATSDIVQETFLQAVQDFPRFQGRSEAELRAWLKQVLLNNIKDAGRRFHAALKRNPSVEAPGQVDGPNSVVARRIADEAPSPSSVCESNEKVAIVRAAVMRLSDEHRRVLELRESSPLTFEAIGALLGRSAAAARKLWLRAVEKLASELDDHDAS